MQVVLFQNLKLYALITTHIRELTCIVEMWLSGTIEDFEINQMNRNRHEEGVLIFVQLILLLMHWPKDLHI